MDFDLRASGPFAISDLENNPTPAYSIDVKYVVDSPDVHHKEVSSATLRNLLSEF